MRKSSDKPKVKAVLQNSWFALFKNASVVKEWKAKEQSWINDDSWDVTAKCSGILGWGRGKVPWNTASQSLVRLEYRSCVLDNC